MKFLVLGVSGMAGHVIALYLHEQGHEVIGFSRRMVTFVPCVAGDAMNTALLSTLLRDGQFDTVINVVGVLNQFAQFEAARAIFLNSYLPHFLAKETAGTSAQVIHLSTDCVFAGNTGPYTEASIPDGKTMYDRSKALGELNDKKNLTLRNSIVGPDLNLGGVGLLNWFLQQTGAVNGYTHAMWTGMTTLQLAKVMEAAALERTHGLYNMVPEHNISKYELLKLFNHFLRSDKVTIRPYEGLTVDKTLVRTCFDFARPVPDYEIMVADMADWMHAHAQLYPHYGLGD